jgi:hypothetical protein
MIRPKTNLAQDLKSVISWQECMSLKITFQELEKVDIQDIRELLDGISTDDTE